MNALLNIESEPSQQFYGVLTDADLEEPILHITNEDDLDITVESDHRETIPDLEDVAPVSQTRSSLIPFLQMIAIPGRPVSTKEAFLRVMAPLARAKALELGDEFDMNDIRAIQLQLALGEHPSDIASALQDEGFTRNFAWALLYMAKPEAFAKMVLS
jgi:hypothetical protein